MNILKQQTEFFQHIFEKRLTPIQVAQLAALTLVGLAGFGVVMSLAVPNWEHTFNLMWKMIVLVIGSIALCLPALYVFSSIRGSKLTILQLLSLVLGSLAIVGIVLLALSPIAGFFTWTTTELEFIQLMNVFMIGLGLLFGLIFLARGFLFSKNRGIDILVLWLMLVAIVLIQMSGKLGPWYTLTV